MIRSWTFFLSKKKKEIKKKSAPKLTKTHANLLFDVEKDTFNNNNNMECSPVNLQIQNVSHCKKSPSLNNNPNQHQTMAITVLQTMHANSSILKLVNINAHTILVEFSQFVIKNLSGNKILTLIKGHNYVTNFRKITGNNPNHRSCQYRFTLVLKILSGNETLTSIEGQ